MSYTMTKTIRFRLDAECFNVVLKKDEVGWVSIDESVFIPPELIKPLAEALLGLAQ